MLGKLILFLASACMIIVATLKTIDFSAKISARGRLDLLKEYHLHACGRSIAAIANLTEAARSKEILERVSSQDIQSAMQTFQETIYRWYQKHYLVHNGSCMDQDTLQMAAKIYLRNADTPRQLNPNFTYRFAPSSLSETLWNSDY